MRKRFTVKAAFQKPQSTGSSAPARRWERTSTTLKAGMGARDGSKEVRSMVMTRNPKQSSNTTDTGGKAAGGASSTEPQKSRTAKREKSCEQRQKGTRMLSVPRATV